MNRRDVRSLASALRTVRERSAPLTPLAAVQAVWPEAVGEAIAAQAEPVSERSGVITVACQSASWAQELDLMQVQLLERLNALIDSKSTALTGLRFSADRARHG